MQGNIFCFIGYSFPIVDLWRTSYFTQNRQLYAGHSPQNMLGMAKWNVNWGGCTDTHEKRGSGELPFLRYNLRGKLYKSCGYVYSAITATENGTVRSVTAQECGGTYLIVLSVDGVPVEADKQIDFEIRSYVVIDGQKVYSETANFSIVGGVCSATAAPLN